MLSILEQEKYQEVLSLAEEGTISEEVFSKYFELVSDNDCILQFDTGDEVMKYLTDNGIEKKDAYRYIFTCVDGDGEKLILLNGWHLCNRLFYVVTKQGWGDGTENDANAYIEAYY